MTTEESLQELINSNKNKSVVIDGKKYFIGKHVKEPVRAKLHEAKEGGILPLAALIPAIIAALSGAAGIAGGIATTVQKAKESQKTDLEKEKLQTEIDSMKKDQAKGGVSVGKGLYLNPYEGSRQKSQGKGLYLDPYKGRGLNDFLKNQISTSESLSSKDKDDFKKICKSLKNGCLCKTKNGKGLYLKPFEL